MKMDLTGAMSCVQTSSVENPNLATPMRDVNSRSCGHGVGTHMHMHTLMAASRRIDIMAPNDKCFVYADDPDVAGRAPNVQQLDWTQCNSN